MKPSNDSRDLSETFTGFLDGCARLLLWLGALLTVATIGLLLFTCFRVTGEGGQQVIQSAIDNVGIFHKVLVVGVIGLAVGSTYLFWGEEVLGVLQLLGAAALFFAPLYVPQLLKDNQTNDAVRAALGVLQQSGAVLGTIALGVLVVDIAVRTRNRVQKGTKADQLKYGKGIKEENDRQNVLMGKCWQLPYCRKFVRERCPIYHSQRTCWKERVGCMCEEEVIRGAMENKAIPKDAVLAANYIPRNARLTDGQKFERCRTCVIYNEHQRHKYKVLLPGVLVGFVLVYALFHGPLFFLTDGVVTAISRAVNRATITNNNFQAPSIFVEGLLAVFFIVSISYALKVLEYVIFKLKL